MIPAFKIGLDSHILGYVAWEATYVLYINVLYHAYVNTKCQIVHTRYLLYIKEI